MSARRGHAGFTLLELLVAMAIFAVVGTLALTGYTQLERQTEYAEQKLARLREVQRAVRKRWVAGPKDDVLPELPIELLLERVFHVDGREHAKAFGLQRLGCALHRLFVGERNLHA